MHSWGGGGGQERPLGLGEHAVVGALRDCQKSSCHLSGKTRKPQQCDRKSEANIGVWPCCKQKDRQAWKAHGLLWILRGPELLQFSESL